MKVNMKRLTPLIIGGIFALTITIVIFTTVVLKHKEVPEGEFKTLVGATYVGSFECKKCHERKYLEWGTTLHPKMMQDAKANPFVIRGDFDTPSKIRTFNKEDVHYTIGNLFRQMYLKKAGDDYEVLPAVYDLTLNKWEVYNSGEKKSWFNKCAGCHATGVDPVKKTFKEAGVGCESCHGPGSNHVKAIPGYEMFTTVNPQRMTSASAAEICGSCHSRGKDKKSAHPFPVEYMTSRGLANLYLHFDLADKKENPEMFWPSGEGKYDYMQYIDWKGSEHAKAGVTCSSCHTVHERKTTFQTRLAGDQQCKSCHTTMGYRSAHRIHTFGSCINCHMPKTAITAGGKIVARSHTFKFISPELSIKMGGVEKQPNSCSGCHQHEKTPLADLVGFLDAAKKADMPKPFSAHRREPLK